MKAANLSDVKNNLSRYIDRVRQGDTIRILVRGVPAADLVPVPAFSQDADGPQWAELERLGLVRRGTGRVRDELLEPGPSAPGRPLTDYLLDERRDGR